MDRNHTCLNLPALNFLGLGEKYGDSGAAGHWKSYFVALTAASTAILSTSKEMVRMIPT